MILRYEHGQLTEQRTYQEALCLEQSDSPVISIVGAGGKTTTAHCIAEEYASLGRPVAVTTTTHLQIEEQPYFLFEEDKGQLLRILEKEKQVWFGKPVPPKKVGKIQKMQSVSEAFFQEVYALHIPMIIEADGARRLPCKVPGEREPVLVKETTMVLAVYGLDAIGKQIQEVCFRAEAVAERLKKNVTDIINAEDIALLAMNRQGGYKGVAKEQSYWIILNKADHKERIEMAKEICEIVSETIPQILVTSHQTAEMKGQKR